MSVCVCVCICLSVFHYLHVHVNAQHLLLPTVQQGICYVWSLSSGVGTSPITLTPRVKKHAHTRHALKCLFSPDSRYSSNT